MSRRLRERQGAMSQKRISEHSLDIETLPVTVGDHVERRQVTGREWGLPMVVLGDGEHLVRTTHGIEILEGKS